MILVRLLGMTFPGAEATMSIWPRHAQATAKQKRATIVKPIARPIGEGGVSTISRAAGKNASSSFRRRCTPGKPMTALADFMDPTLQPVQRRVAAPGPHQFVVCAILGQTATIYSDDAIRPTHGGQPVGDDE